MSRIDVFLFSKFFGIFAITMGIQLTLFPDYPCSLPTKIVTRPDPLDWAWELFDYPESDPEDMAENPLHGDQVIAIKNALTAMLSQMPNSFVAMDTFFYYTIRQKVEGVINVAQQKLAPDVLVVLDLPKRRRGSFSLEKERQYVQRQHEKKNPNAPPLDEKKINWRMLTVEVMSPSNYADKNDQWKRWNFYNQAGVEEYIVIHTEDEANLSIEMFYRRDGVLMRQLNFSEQTSFVGRIKLCIVNNELVIKDLDNDIFHEYKDERLLRKEAEAKADTEQKARLKAEADALEEQKAYAELEKRLQEVLKLVNTPEKAAA